MNCPHGYEYQPDDKQHNALRSDCPHCRVAQLEGDLEHMRQSRANQMALMNGQRVRAESAEAKLKECEDASADTAVLHDSVCKRLCDAEAKVAALEEAIDQSKDATAAQIYMALKHQLNETESSRDDYKARCEALDKVRKAAKRAMKSFHQPDSDGFYDDMERLKTALAATEVKP